MFILIVLVVLCMLICGLVVVVLVFGWMLGEVFVLMLVGRVWVVYFSDLLG